MRATLRRSCAACAKAKHSCDLRTPKCSRCVKRKSTCEYANEPLTSTFSKPAGGHSSRNSVHSSPRELEDGRLPPLSFVLSGPVDPFETYPSINLPPLRVQGLIHHFLSKIAFQYYPLDMNPTSNPFLVSWWPLALQDPALFNVSLQTASLDDEFHAQKGFSQSESLMKDCLSLIRHKVQDSTAAFQDVTLNAIIILAAIEEGKGNSQTARVHVNGVKSMVGVRGGLVRIREASPLTARMVAWVSMVVTGTPQFLAQDDYGRGDGVSSIPQWQFEYPLDPSGSDLINLDHLLIDQEVQNIFTRLRHMFNQIPAESAPDIELSSTDIHDLTSFVLHRLLTPFTPYSLDSNLDDTSECLRLGTSIYMLLIHGPTYYPHAAMLHGLISQLKLPLSRLLSSPNLEDSLAIWLVSVGTVGSLSTTENIWFSEKASSLCRALGLDSWQQTEFHLRRVLWLEPGCRDLFRKVWENIFNPAPESSAFRTSPSAMIVG